ncbi:MAG: hypothetical protein IPQ19_02740 [Bacteroidetes bacterium]|nr:hypothetical protein [Bacteroidota bacterium]
MEQNLLLKLERLDGGFVGYAVDTIYGFNVDGEIVDTIWLTDLTGMAIHQKLELQKLNLYATNSKGISGIAFF